MSRAYYVERVSRCVVVVLVHAENAREARSLGATGEGESVDVRYEARGVASVRRAPAEDDDS